MSLLASLIERDGYLMAPSTISPEEIACWANELEAAIRNNVDYQAAN